MKRLIVLFILLIVLSVPVFAGNNTIIGYDLNDNASYTDDNDDVVYALEDGHFNTNFTDDYNGYCLEYGEQEAKTGDKFYVTNTDNINNDDSKVSYYLKTYFLRYYDYAMKDKIVTQHMIWHFTDGFEGWRLNYTIIHDIESNPLMVEDDGYYKYNSTHFLKYSFREFVSPYIHHQNFFGYKIFLVNNTTLDNVVNITSNMTLGGNVSDLFSNSTINQSIITYHENVSDNNSFLLNKLKSIGSQVFFSDKEVVTGNPLVLLFVGFLCIGLLFVVQFSVFKRKK